jgi:hypothetical protein
MEEISTGINLAQVADTGGVLVIALLLLKVIFNDLKHINDKMTVTNMLLSQIVTSLKNEKE